MTNSNEQQDGTGIGTLVVALLLLVGVALSPAVVGWTKTLIGF